MLFFAFSGCLEYDTGLIESDLRVWWDVASALACKQLCRDEPGCVYFTYHTVNYEQPRKCVLKTTDVGASTFVGLISGRPHC